MIPKKIHFCWFGGKEKPKLAKKCIDSWQKYCPDYEIIEWNEQNFNVNLNEYTRMCYEEKKYAFLSDYVRLYVVEKYGGVYFDVDVEVIRSIDSLLNNKAFFGFETEEYVNTGVGFGAEQGNFTVKKMLDAYSPILDGKSGTIGCPILNTKALIECGLVTNGKKQELPDATIYPIECFNPYDDPTGCLQITKKTYSIHWFAKSWLSKDKIIRSKLMKPIHRVFGINLFHRRK